ncbi:hypothetical protein [Halopiger aswanensis]|uniref:Uncharacterized protein n=1 Tax=Halopiger aswanensis TaxID=148449 RepID=A0A3R7DWD1_9EURY|nr:hypothetical protein [Halopiger aswanensis]RKD86225.1 hypothetical protein ATJ93_4642 [Halopiger aswanensis]
MADDWEHDWVEAAWEQALVEAGVDRSAAKSITARLQSQQALTAGTNSADEVRRHVTRAIEDLDLGAYGVPDTEREDVKAELEATLEAGFDGDLKGPVALRAPSGDRTARPVNATVDVDRTDDRPSVATDDRDAVEDVWRERLVEAGVDKSTAKSITTRLQSQQALTAGANSADEVRRHVMRAIGELDLTAYGIDEDVESAVKADLERALDNGLDGDLRGPAAVRTPSETPQYRPTNATVEDASAAPEGVDEPGRPPTADLGAAPAGTGVANRRPSEDVSADESDADPSPDDVQRLREELRRIAADNDLTKADVETTVDTVVGDRSIADLEGAREQLATELERLVEGGAVTERELRTAVDSLYDE